MNKFGFNTSDIIITLMFSYIFNTMPMSLLVRLDFSSLEERNVENLQHHITFLFTLSYAFSVSKNVQ